MTSPRPDIILICIDDLGATDLGCFGSSFYETPHLDALAAKGMRFTQAYATCHVCSPTRASLMTGRYPARVGITNFIGAADHGRLALVPYLNHLPATLATLPGTLRESGYATWHVGKWHLGGEGSLPSDRGFEVNVGGWHWGHPRHGHQAPWGIPTLPDAEPGTWLTDHLTDRCIGLLRERDRTKPYFLNLWHYTVHTPIQAPENLIAKYRAKAARLGLDQLPTLIQGEHFPCSHKRDKRVVRRLIQSDPTYAAMMEQLDDNIGRLLAAVAEHGDPANTLVVFTSDNGGLATAEGAPTSNRPWFEGKGWAYEGGIRVCQIAHWPGRIAPGSASSAVTVSTDLFPTFLAAAGLPLRPTDHCDGVSLLPVFAGGDIDREAVFWHYPHYGNQGHTPSSSVRCGGWKLIETFETGKIELYDLAQDPSETRDRSTQEPARTRDLHRRLKAWRTEVAAKIPEPDPAWRPEVAALWDAADI